MEAELERVGNMTKAELNQIIETTARRIMYAAEAASTKKLSWKEFVEAVEPLRIHPQPGTPSVVELLREDRDR